MSKVCFTPSFAALSERQGALRGFVSRMVISTVTVGSSSFFTSSGCCAQPSPAFQTPRPPGRGKSAPAWT